MNVVSFRKLKEFYEIHPDSKPYLTSWFKTVRKAEWKDFNAVTEKEYNDAIMRLDQLFDAPLGSQEAKEADVLALLINQYEEEHYPIDEPAPEEHIRIRMEETGLRENSDS